MSRLTARELTLAYEDHTVVHELDLAVPDGQVTVIVGPNACGKSTTLRALGRLLKPRGGGAPIAQIPLLCSALMGAVIVVLADLLARKLLAPTELPVGVLTAAIGAPYLIWLIIRSRTAGAGA